MRCNAEQKDLITIAVCETDPLRLIGVHALLSGNGFELLATSPDDIEAMVSCDITLTMMHGGVDTFALIKRLQERQPDVRIIVIGPASDDQTIAELVARGVKGYISDSVSAQELQQAIRVVKQGLIWASRRVFGAIIERVGTFASCSHYVEGITQRKREVLELLVAGRSNKEIAVPLGIEERTVKAHVSKLMRKLGVQNRIALSVRAVSRSLVSV